MRAAEHGHRPGKAPAVAVEHRQRPQVLREMRHGPGRRVAHRVEVGAAVVRHAQGRRWCRRCSSTAMASHSSRGPRARPAARAASSASYSCAEALAGAAVLAVADVDDHRAAAVLGFQDAQRLAHQRREFAVGDHHRASAVVHLPGQQGASSRVLSVLMHRVERGNRVVRLDHLRRVGQHGRHRGAAHHAQRRSAATSARRTVAQLCPVVAPRAVDHRRQVAEPPRRCVRRSSPGSGATKLAGFCPSCWS